MYLVRGTMRLLLCLSSFTRFMIGNRTLALPYNLKISENNRGMMKESSSRKMRVQLTFKWIFSLDGGRRVDISDVCVCHSMSVDEISKLNSDSKNILCVSAWQSTVDKLKKFAYLGSRLHLNSLKGIGNENFVLLIRRVNAFRFCVRSFAIAIAWCMSSLSSRCRSSAIDSWSFRHFFFNFSFRWRTEIWDIWEKKSLSRLSSSSAWLLRGTKPVSDRQN